ncbi:hypothetical protein CCP2SC5_190026 [Azospirillaceae bacterium]
MTTSDIFSGDKVDDFSTKSRPISWDSLFGSHEVEAKLGDGAIIAMLVVVRTAVSNVFVILR